MLTISDDYFSKDLSDRGHEASRGGAGQRAGIQKQTAGLTHLNHPES